MAEFVPPLECPVFAPNWDDFADPFAFIRKIWPIAQQTGICKVRPPPGWQPPFACDLNQLHFAPRIQRLNQLEAQTRVKLNFLDRITKFWQLQGFSFQIPQVERKILDLFQLNRLVDQEGGYDLLCRDRKWTEIATKMGFTPDNAVGTHIRSHYERILYPYNVFQTGASLRHFQKPNITRDTRDKESTPHDSPRRQSVQPLEMCPSAHPAKHMTVEAANIQTDAEETTETKTHNLRHRMGSTSAKPDGDREAQNIEAGCFQQPDGEKPKRRSTKNFNAVDLFACRLCGSGNYENCLLLCDGCDDSCHTFCLIPPLHDVPKGDWRCPQCLAQEWDKPQEAFGFEEAAQDYTLHAFGEMAHAFKSNYFNMPVPMVPVELVEKEFWRLLSTIEEDVIVEYGSDIASKEFGSGFPVRGGKIKLKPEEERYLDSGWNLNNMPVMEESLLSHIAADICGMKLPWLYVGMCFTSFCWHTEDHWSYSINYLHWGEPKTWYSAPGYAAEQLEDVMKKLAPELFESQPDLLHHLVTMMNPNTLMSHGVPIYRTNQYAGEFVITFPRAYHCGFNQGFNFAEAVNFCTVDWLPLGRQCVEHYRLLNRHCVFSHDEMICRMATKAETLDVVVALTAEKDMAIIIEEEKVLRNAAFRQGVTDLERMNLEVLPDEERQCMKCNTTCYMSAISCTCHPGLLVCLYHVEDLCTCPTSQYKMGYRYTVDELYTMMNTLKLRAESYNEWVSNVNEALEANVDNKKSLVSFKGLIEESEMRKFPDSDLLRHLRLVTQDAEKCSLVAQQLLNGERQTMYWPGRGRSQHQLTVNELRLFVRQLHALPCVISQTTLLKELLHCVEDFQKYSQKLLSEEIPSASQLRGLLDIGFEFNVNFPQLDELRIRLEQARWLEDVNQICSDQNVVTLDNMRRLIYFGVGLAPHPTIEKTMAKLQKLLTVSEYWDNKAKMLIKARPRQTLRSFEAAVKEIEQIPAYVPNSIALKDAVKKAKDWLQEVESLQADGRVPILDTLVELVSRSRSIPVHLEYLPRLESLVAEVQAWKDHASNTFLTENSPYSLLEALCPRSDMDTSRFKRKTKKLKEPAPNGEKGSTNLESLSGLERALSESKEIAAALATLIEAHLKEIETLHSLRVANEEKTSSNEQRTEVKVCLCQKEPAAPMIQCELCRGVFHTSCVSGPSSLQEPRVWLCPQCHQSEKPPLEKILPLLASLQHIRTSLPEGDVLQYLIERTMNWQQRVHQVLFSRNVKLIQENTGPEIPYSREQTMVGQLHETSEVSQTIGATSFSLLHDWNNRPRQLHSLFSTGQNCIPLHARSTELNELMMEAQFLQVSLPEIQELYKTWLTKASSVSETEQRSPVGLANEKKDCRGKRDGICSKERKPKRRFERSDLCSEMRTRVRKRTPNKKKLKSAQLRKPNNSKLEREKLFDIQQSGESQLLLSNMSLPEQAESQDENAICPADNCLQPEDDEVDWVQCDGSCNQWFHQVCVGISPEMAEKEDYICASCTGKNLSYQN